MAYTNRADAAAKPKAKREPRPCQLAGTPKRDAAVPVLVRGQKYVSPPSRHSQQSHIRAVVRGEVAGFTSERELYDADRVVVSDGIAEVAKQKKLQEKNNVK